MKKLKIFLLILLMVITVLPVNTLADEDTSYKEPNVLVYATEEQLMDGTFAPDSDGVAKNIGKILFGKNTKIDGKKFAEEYTSVTKDNVFVYRSAEEIINILEHGTGVVYLGFPECPWCTAYVPYLNEVAKANDVDKVYYYNILNDRKDNTDNYKKMVDILKDYLKFDEEGNKRIYAPSVIAVKDGEILDFDDETAWDTKGYKTPEEYWKNEDLEGLKEKLAKMFEETKTNICTSNCNK